VYGGSWDVGRGECSVTVHRESGGVTTIAGAEETVGSVERQEVSASSGGATEEVRVLVGSG
jgi:hypothetical protein